MPAKLPVADTRFICVQCRKTLSSSARRRRLVSTNAFSASAASSSTPEVFDIVTVGGGPAGLALLAALKSSPITSHLKTALIETQDLSKLRQWSSSEDRYSNRASSLTPSSMSFLEKEAGAWDHVDQSRVQAYDEMQVWDASNDASIQFDWTAETSKYNAPPRTVATMTENANLTRALLERIAQLGAEASLFSSTSVASITNGDDDPNGLNLSTWPVLRLESKPAPQAPSSSPSRPSTIAARLLVGADGFNSPVRTFAGISSHGWDYHRHGVVATLTVQPADTDISASAAEDFDFDLFSAEPQANRATAYQRFLPDLGGPVAVLPLPNNHASLVWSTTPANAAYLKSLPPAAQRAMINAALRLSQTDIQYMFTLPAGTSSDPEGQQHEDELQWRLQHTPAPSISRPVPLVTSVQENTLASFPLRLRHATSLTGPRVALVGDAAHTIHPLAGQGLNLGLADAACLADTVAYAVRHGMDIGDGFALERYNAARFGRGLVMAGGVDALHWTYQMGSGSGGSGGIVSSVLARARGLGMNVVESGLVPGLKSLIMKQAT
ncbi:ubiquinone biosynthesis monooxygenase COQ6 [Fonsecaea erecta]|uniref:Ubiquinone biosynthesis monooxygenase COQ6, mitochondrial n=1 Tax=Fonsecaea erecta TaxID=1367422 RepID=A0A178ZVT5_9EURO|nr:ubiquinone biosynthesis monooxygenase COQ6 [Fonsecaea erecta]OAP63910.1 ubiquinone biosynthesis monooxygenase COQ6 [Fonsecaea erecta]